MVNGISGGAADLCMAPLLAASDVPWVLTHSRGASADMARRAVYDDVVREVVDELQRRVDHAAYALGNDLHDARGLQRAHGVHDRLFADAELGFHFLDRDPRTHRMAKYLRGFDSAHRPIITKEIVDYWCLYRSPDDPQEKAQLMIESAPLRCGFSRHAAASSWCAKPSLLSIGGGTSTTPSFSPCCSAAAWTMAGSVPTNTRGLSTPL
jgi:hypothetical protein